MISQKNIDGGKSFDWSRTSRDYSDFRPGYSSAFYEILKNQNMGLPGQKILDLGTGTGELALNFAEAGCEVTGIDLAENQLKEAQVRAADRGLSINFQLIAAEDYPFNESEFDLVSASMCWIYFDKKKLIPGIKKMLKPGGRLLICSHIWLPLEDEIAHKTEELVLKYNPDWTGAGFTVKPYNRPQWADGFFDAEEYITFREPVRFTRESWRGRIRACRGVGASLPQERIDEFDHELNSWLLHEGLDEFDILHWNSIEVYQPSRS